VRNRTRWVNLEIRPDAPATIEYSEPDDAYWLTWQPVGLAIGLSQDELRAMVADAILVQTQATMTSDAS